MQTIYNRSVLPLSSSIFPILPNSLPLQALQYLPHFLDFPDPFPKSQPGYLTLLQSPISNPGPC